MTSGTSASLGNKKHGRRHKMGAGKHKRPVWGPDHGKGKDKFAAYGSWDNVDVTGCIFVVIVVGLIAAWVFDL